MDGLSGVVELGQCGCVIITLLIIPKPKQSTYTKEMELNDATVVERMNGPNAGPMRVNTSD
jgi:hypothetical protein